MAKLTTTSNFSMDSVDMFAQSPSGGFANFSNEFGLQSDPNFNTVFLPPLEFTQTELRDLYQNPLVNRVVTLHAEDGVGEGFELFSKKDVEKSSDMNKYMDDTYNWKAIGGKMIAIRHLYRGGVIFVDVEDGRDNSEPLNRNAVKKVYSFQPVESFYAKPLTPKKLTGVEKPGQPMHYMITLQGFGGSETFTCHESRLIRFPTFESDNVIGQIDRVRRMTWPFSTAQLIYDAVKRYSVSVQSEAQLVQGFVEDIFKIKSLSQHKDLEGLRTYIRNQRLLRTSMRATVIGADDEIQKSATPTTGLSEITLDMRRDIGMNTGIPVPILFSEESGALGGSTLSESRKVWYDSVSRKQENQYTPMFMAMLDFVALEKNWDISDVKIVWNPLFCATEKDLVTMRNLQAQTDKMYWEMGMPESAIFKSRFSKEKVDMHSFDFDPDEYEDQLREFDRMTPNKSQSGVNVNDPEVTKGEPKSRDVAPENN